MDKKIIEYRKKHKKCKWCKWFNHFSKPTLEFEFDECILKDKYLSCFDCLQDLKAKVCKHYEVKEDNNEISIDKTNKS